MKRQFELIKIFLFLMLVFPTLSPRDFVFHFENCRSFFRMNNCRLRVSKMTQYGKILGTQKGKNGSPEGSASVGEIRAQSQ